MSKLTRRLCVEDNLEVLARLDARSVTVAYLDPPFNSGRPYEAIVSTGWTSGTTAPAFDDQWSWSSDTEAMARELHRVAPRPVEEFVAGLVRTLGRNDLAAYLVMMTSRLTEAHRVLAEDGSLYVHCDPAASHYLKVVLDLIFGPENFRNEVVWKRTHAHSSSRRYGPVHDTILFYSKSPRYFWQKTYASYSTAYIDKYFTREDSHGRYQLITCNAPGDRTGTRAHYEWRGQYPPAGRHWAWKREQMEEFERAGRLVHSSNGVPRLKRYIDDGAGVALQDVWTDINRLDAHSIERTGYETQKPLALLDRILEASSREGDLVLDIFCGTGTTLVSAERLKRQWIGVDTSLLGCSIALARVRQETKISGVELVGFPADVKAALRLRRDDPVAYGMWGTSLLATLADRRASTPTLAAGTGLIRLRGKQVELMSWVPLRSRAARFLPSGPKRFSRLSKAAFVLRAGTGDASLSGWVASQLDIPVREVPLEELVAPEVKMSGIARSVVA